MISDKIRELYYQLPADEKHLLVKCLRAQPLPDQEQALKISFQTREKLQLDQKQNCSKTDQSRD